MQRRWMKFMANLERGGRRGGGDETLLALMVDCPKDHFKLSHKYDNLILINCSSDEATRQKINFRKIPLKIYFFNKSKIQN